MIPTGLAAGERKRAGLKLPRCRPGRVPAGAGRILGGAAGRASRAARKLLQTRAGQRTHQATQGRGGQDTGARIRCLRAVDKRAWQQAPFRPALPKKMSVMSVMGARRESREDPLPGRLDSRLGPCRQGPAGRGPGYREESSMTEDTSGFRESWKGPQPSEKELEQERRELEEAGWEHVEDAVGKTLWRKPDSGHLYPQDAAVTLIRGKNEADDVGEEPL